MTANVWEKDDADLLLALQYAPGVPVITRKRGGKIILLYLVMLLLAGVLWSLPVKRPLDLPSWHEFDDAAIARNFVREPSGILKPRIDWRRDGPGFVESEFPLYPWLLSQCYRIWGINIIYGRILSLCASLGFLLLFLLIAKSLLPEAGAVTALLLFSTNRIINFVATSLQPEAFLLLFYMASVFAFLRWRANRSRWAFFAAVSGVALAILEKSPAAHLGLFFLIVIVSEEGWKGLRAGANWAFAVCSLLPPALWYLHARKLWLVYGNSLGISNEHHWLDWDILTNVSRPAGLAAIELFLVFSVGGVILALFGTWNWRNRPIRFAVFWFASIALYYLVTIRTTGALWAWYYHVVSVAPMALLGGAGVARMFEGGGRRRVLVAGALSSVAVLWFLLPGLGLLSHAHQAYFFNLNVTRFSLLQLMSISVVCTAAVMMIASVASLTRSESLPAARVFPMFLCAAGIAGYLFVSATLVTDDLARYRVPSSEWEAAKSFRTSVPEHALLLTSGGICADYSGHKAAYDAPYMLYWLDRKGFSICTEEQSISKVLSLAARGADFFVAEKTAVRAVPGFEAALKQRFSLLSESQAAWLFDLRTSPPLSSASARFSSAR